MTIKQTAGRDALGDFAPKFARYGVEKTGFPFEIAA